MRAISASFLLMSMAASAQPQKPLTFEVASIRAAQSGPEGTDVGPGSLTMHNTRLNAVISWAYSVQEIQISGPGWLPDTRFDIFAKAAGPASEPELRQMLQTLLADRLKLSIHRDIKEMAAYVLTIGKNGHKLQPVDKEGSPSFKTGKLNLTGQGATLNQLTVFLARALREPIVDQTGLTGRFNYFLDIDPYVTDEIRKGGGPDGGPPPEGASIIATALQAQLGLKLESKKAPIEMIVVDRVEKTASEN